MSDSATFTWLHLTDLHFGQSNQRPFWPNVREAFFDDLEDQCSQCGPLQAVFFTGDLVDAGDGFERMESEVLGRLWRRLEALGSGAAKLFAVPGNHDLLRPTHKPLSPALRYLIKPNGYAEIADEFWEYPSCAYREVCERSFDNYSKWWQGARTRSGVTFSDGLMPGDFSATIAGNQYSLGVVGLNSTFLQLASGDYRRRLACDLRQFQAVCNDDASDWIRRHDACILLTHQGRDWLDPRSNQMYSEINPSGQFAIHLYGHMHEADYQERSSGGGEALRFWQGRSFFGLDTVGEPPVPRRSHGYSIGKMKLDREGISLRLFPRKAVHDLSNGWRFVRDEESFVLQPDGGTKPARIANIKGRRVNPTSIDEPRSRGRIDNEVAANLEPIFSDVNKRKLQDLESKEEHSRAARRNDDVYNILISAIGSRLPPEIMSEIENLFRIEVIRIDCEYIISFLPPIENNGDSFTIRREMAFTAVNLTSEAKIFPVRSQYLKSFKVGTSSSRHFTRLAVNGQDIAIEEGKNLAANGDWLQLEELVQLGPRGGASVYIGGEEHAFVRTNQVTYIQASSAIGMRVEVRNGYPEKIKGINVLMNHPAAHETRVDAFGRYELRRAFLPGQGFQVIWDGKRSDQEP